MEKERENEKNERKRKNIQTKTLIVTWDRCVLLLRGWQMFSLIAPSWQRDILCNESSTKWYKKWPYCSNRGCVQYRGRKKVGVCGQWDNKEYHRPRSWVQLFKLCLYENLTPHWLEYLWACLHSGRFKMITRCTIHSDGAGPGGRNGAESLIRLWTLDFLLSYLPLTAFELLWLSFFHVRTKHIMYRREKRKEKRKKQQICQRQHGKLKWGKTRRAKGCSINKEQPGTLQAFWGIVVEHLPKGTALWTDTAFGSALTRSLYKVIPLPET